MKEHKVGEIFQYVDVQIRVEKERRLYESTGCCFYNLDCFMIDREKCAGDAREDGVSVIFVEVNEKNQEI